MNICLLLSVSNVYSSSFPDLLRMIVFGLLASFVTDNLLRQVSYPGYTPIDHGSRWSLPVLLSVMAESILPAPSCGISGGKIALGMTGVPFKTPPEYLERHWH